MREGLLVPAEVLFEGVRGGNESLAVQRALGEWLTPGDELFFEALDRANAIRNSILQAEVVAYEIDADANDDNVIEIFARLNQQGVRLRPGDLAAARLTGQMTNFRVRAREVFAMKEMRGFSAPEGARGGRPRRCAGRHRSADPLRAVPGRRRRSLPRRRRRRRRRRNYQNIAESWERAVAGFKSAIALFKNAGVPSGRLAALSLSAVPAGDRGGPRPRDRRQVGGMGGGGQPVASLRGRGRHQAGKRRGAGGGGRRRRSAGTRAHARQAPRKRRSRGRGPASATSSARGRSSSRCWSTPRKVDARSLPRRQAAERRAGAAGGARRSSRAASSTTIRAATTNTCPIGWAT